MSKSRETWNKKEMETIRKKKREEKEKRKSEKKADSKSSGKRSFEEMIAYVDENGQLTTVAPDKTKKKEEIDVDSIQISVSRKEFSDEEEPDFTGVVAFFNTSKGYGFIKDPAANKSYFVHINDLLSPIKEGDKVSFKTAASQRGLKAVEVKVMG